MYMTKGNAWAVVAVCCQLLVGSHVSAQDTSSAFERCWSYAMEFEELDNSYAIYISSREKLSKERIDALNRLARTNRAITQLVTYEGMQRMAALENQMFAAIQETSLEGSVSGATAAQPTNRADALQAGQQVSQARVQLDVLYHQMKTADQAGRLVLEQRRSIVEELQSIGTELRAFDAKSLELFDGYWQAADVAAVKSNLELRAGLRCLQQADSGNEGAQFALAITWMRLKDFDRALPLLNQLVETPAVRSIALAARAELYVRMGKVDLSTIDMRQALAIAKTDPRVRMHCAMAFAAAGNLRAAQSEWEAVLKLGTQEIAARRAIAFIHAAAANPSDHNKKIASEYSQLAAKLAGEEDWACQMACALAAHVNGQVDEAIASAQRASDAAMGDRRVYCDAALAQLKQGARPSWQF